MIKKISWKKEFFVGDLVQRVESWCNRYQSAKKGSLTNTIIAQNNSPLCRAPFAI